MNKLEYSLNALAWSLAGVVLTLTYQRIATWLRKRDGKGELPPISASTYFGTGLLLIGMITALFSYSAKLSADRRADCQVRVTENNIAAANQKNALLAKFVSGQLALDSRELKVIITQDKDGLRKITAALKSAISSGGQFVVFTKSNPATPIKICDQSDNSSPTPSVVPSITPAKPSPSK